jgi:hypothetical protein
MAALATGKLAYGPGSEQKSWPGRECRGAAKRTDALGEYLDLISNSYNYLQIISVSPSRSGAITHVTVAVAGRGQSVADQRAKFTTGINYEGKNVLMAPNPPLAECWTKVESAQAAPSTCIALRRHLQVP